MVIGFALRDLFQSTLPVRGATLQAFIKRMNDEFQSTLPVRGATTGGKYIKCGFGKISIHAPREGSDPADNTVLDGIRHFNPRSP